MRGVRIAAQLVLVAVVCAAGTLWLGWPTVVVTGFVYGLFCSRVRARGFIAALGAALAWVGLLGAELARGADIRMVATRIGAVMHVPAIVLLLLTLVFGAILAGTAAVLGAAIAAAVTRPHSAQRAHE